MSFTCIDHSTGRVNVELDASQIKMPEQRLPETLKPTPYDDTFIRDYMSILQNEIGFLRDEVRDVKNPDAAFDYDWWNAALAELNKTLQAATLTKDITQPAVNPRQNPWMTAMAVTNDLIKTFSLLAVAILFSLFMVQYL